MFPVYRILQRWSLLLQSPLTVQCSHNHLQPCLHMSKQLFPCEEHQELQQCVSSNKFLETPLDDLEKSKQWLICCNPNSFTRIRNECARRITERQSLTMANVFDASVKTRSIFGWTISFFICGAWSAWKAAHDTFVCLWVTSSEPTTPTTFANHSASCLSYNSAFIHHPVCIHFQVQGPHIHLSALAECWYHNQVV